MTELSIICQIIFIYSVINSVISLEDDCPVGQYRCQSSVKKCIELTKICDGKKDCPKGEDEVSSYCKEASLSRNYLKYNPGKSYANSANKYMKQENNLIGKHNNANDDGGNRYWPNNGCGAGQYLCNGTLNICVKLNEICNGKQDCPENDDEDREACANRQQNNLIISNGLPALMSDKSLENYRNLAGTGFMFHVDNLIIYNSDVRMFNQNSDNNEK